MACNYNKQHTLLDVDQTAKNDPLGTCVPEILKNFYKPDDQSLLGFEK